MLHAGRRPGVSSDGRHTPAFACASFVKGGVSLGVARTVASLRPTSRCRVKRRDAAGHFGQFSRRA